MTVRCAEFIGCVACGRYDIAPKEDPGEMLMCCGIPMYEETIPVTPENRGEIDRAYIRTRSGRRAGRGTKP